MSTPECSFTCPLTCTGPGDTDHESEVDRRARLGVLGRTLDSEESCTRCGAPDLHCFCPAVVGWLESPPPRGSNGFTRNPPRPGSVVKGEPVYGSVPNIVPEGFWAKTSEDYEAYAIRQANARILAETEVEKLKAEYVALAGIQANARLALQAEVERLRIDNETMEDDLLTMLKVRNEALRQAACEVIVGPDGQDDLDRSRLIRGWVEEAYAELGISEPDWAWVPVVEPKASLVEWGNHDRLGSATREGGGASSAAVPTPAPGPSPPPVIDTRFVMLCLEDDETNACYLPLGHDGEHEYQLSPDPAATGGPDDG
jgi:hypothetical protein